MKCMSHELFVYGAPAALAESRRLERLVLKLSDMPTQDALHVCCGVLQCVAVCCSVLQCFAVWRSLVQCVAVC